MRTNKDVVADSPFTPQGSYNSKPP